MIRLVIDFILSLAILYLGYKLSIKAKRSLSRYHKRGGETGKHTKNKGPLPKVPRISQLGWEVVSLGGKNLKSLNETIDGELLD
jgi:hypothetical protein